MILFISILRIKSRRLSCEQRVESGKQGKNLKSHIEVSIIEESEENVSRNTYV